MGLELISGHLHHHQPNSEKQFLEVALSCSPMRASALMTSTAMVAMRNGILRALGSEELDEPRSAANVSDNQPVFANNTISGSRKVWKRHSGLWVEHPIYFRNLGCKILPFCTTTQFTLCSRRKTRGSLPSKFTPDSGGLVYTFAAVPEPSTLSRLGLGAQFTVVKTPAAADIPLSPTDPVFPANASIISQFQKITHKKTETL